MPDFGSAVWRRSKVSSPSPLVYSLRRSVAARGATGTGDALGSMCTPPTASATDGSTSAPIGSSAHAGPSRAQPASVLTSTMHDTPTITQP